MTNLLDDAEIADMQAEVLDVALPDTCSILAVTYTSDGQGGLTEAWGTATVSVACRFDPVTSREQLSGEAIQPFSRFLAFMPYDTTVTQANRLKWGSVEYNILGIDSTRSWNLNLILEVEKV